MIKSDDLPEVECEDCGWQGDSNMLEAASDDLDDTAFIYCPECGSDDVNDIDWAYDLDWDEDD